MGMAVYFCIDVLFGGGFGLLAMIVHEDNDRCHYYHGEWNRGDLTRGCLAVAVGCVVGDEHVDRAIQKTLDERVLIGLIA